MQDEIKKGSKSNHFNIQIKNSIFFVLVANNKNAVWIYNL
jgi:hypothetical protein